MLINATYYANIEITKLKNRLIILVPQFAKMQDLKDNIPIDHFISQKKKFTAMNQSKSSNFIPINDCPLCKQQFSNTNPITLLYVPPNTHIPEYIDPTNINTSSTKTNITKLERLNWITGTLYFINKPTKTEIENWKIFFLVKFKTITFLSTRN